MSALQKLTMEHTEYTERVRLMNKRIIFGHWVHVRKSFTTLFSMKDKIIFSLCDLRGLCGGKITFLQWSHDLSYCRIIPSSPSTLAMGSKRDTR